MPAAVPTRTTAKHAGVGTIVATATAAQPSHSKIDAVLRGVDSHPSSISARTTPAEIGNTAQAMRSTHGVAFSPTTKSVSHRRNSFGVVAKPPADAIERVEELRALVVAANRAYHELDQPEIPDADYDLASA